MPIVNTSDPAYHDTMSCPLRAVGEHRGMSREDGLKGRGVYEARSLAQVIADGHIPCSGCYPDGTKWTTIR